MTKMKLESLESYESYDWDNCRKYFGVLPDINLDIDDEIINSLINSNLYFKHKYYDERINILPKDKKFNVARFQNGYNQLDDIRECFYQYLYNSFVFHYIDNEIIKIEMITKTNLKYLVNFDQRSRKLENKINSIFEDNDEEYLYYLNLYNEDQTELFLKWYTKLDCAIGLSKLSRPTVGFTQWDYLLFKYYKGETINREDIPSLEKWRKLALLDVELRYYNEVLKNLQALSNVDYFNSISHLNTYKNLSKNDRTFYLKIKSTIKDEQDVNFIFKICLNTSERTIPFFRSLYLYLYNDNFELNRFNFIGKPTYENIIKSSYPELNNFAIGTNPLSKTFKNLFSGFENKKE